MKHLTRGERYEIQMYSLLGMNKSEIARILHVLKSSITREFQRNSDVKSKGTYYFAKPYHSWERGSNENLNGLIRQYIPKGTDFDTLTREDILAIQEKINNRPRKRLAFSSPNDIFVKLTRLDPKCCV